MMRLLRRTTVCMVLLAGALYGVAGQIAASTLSVASGFELLNAVGTGSARPYFDFEGQLGLGRVYFRDAPGLIGSNPPGGPGGCGRGQFDFGDGNGCQGTGSASTIIHRMEDVDAPTDAIEIELVALSLASVDRIDLGLGLGPEPLRIRLLKDMTSGVFKMGNDDGSEATIDTDADGLGGTLSSDLKFTFDLYGRKSGFLGAFSFDLSQRGGIWGRVIRNGTPSLQRRNYLLNGVDTSNDFHSALDKDGGYSGQFTCGVSGNARLCTAPALPIPAAMPMLASGIALLALFGLRKRGRMAAI